MPRTSPRFQSTKRNEHATATVNSSDALHPIGSKVRKLFEGHGWFQGEVVSILDDGTYHVLYEDGDEESYDSVQLQEILVASVATSQVKEDDDEGSMEEEEYFNNLEDSEDNDDELSVMDCDDDIAIVEADTPTKKSTSVNTSAVVTPSPAKNKKNKKTETAKPKETNENPNKNKDKRTIAVRGLPRGALAKCPASGFTLRALESLRPLHGSSNNSFFLHTTTRKEKSKKAKKPTDLLLPGKFIVVHVDEEEVCPSDWIGKEFASAAHFYKAIPSNTAIIKIDYDMHVVADPVFGPWEFCHARLASTGLLDDDDDDAKKSCVGPMVYVAQIQWSDTTGKVFGSVSWYKDFMKSRVVGTKDDLQWAIIEASQRDTPSVLVGAPLSLVEHNSNDVTEDLDDAIKSDANDTLEETATGSDKDLVPPPSTKVTRLRLPASLLQKSIRRGTGLCSPAPLLEACRALLLPRRPGATLAMLKAVWGCMLVDASPFDEDDDCLGLPSLLLLSLVAKAHPKWTMPASLRQAAVASALRTAQSAPSKPWLGFVERSDDWWKLELEGEDERNYQRALQLRNMLRAAQTVVGGRLAWGKWNSFIGDASAAALLAYLNPEWDGSHLPVAPKATVDEAKHLAVWQDESSPLMTPPEARLLRLDQECRLAAYEPTVLPSTLVILQAVLSRPPTRWKKHGLPSLSRQIRKLVSEANARIQERVQLARLATWGKEQSAESTPNASGQAAAGINKSSSEELDAASPKYKSFRDVVTPSSTLSEQEIEVIECFEAIQKWLADSLECDTTVNIQDAADTAIAVTASEEASADEANHTHFVQVKAGAPLTPFDGRVAFLLAFATSMEVEVCPDPECATSTEVVSVMFCGDAEEPLLVQRIGKARKEGQEAVTAGGTTSGATAVPSLGYVQRKRSAKEAKLVEAAEMAVAKIWNGGKTSPLPLPPAGLQWDLPGDGASDVGWEEKEVAVQRTAELVADAEGNKTWHFAIAGKKVDAFDARAVVSPCALDLGDECHRPEPLERGSERDRCLRLALYALDQSDFPYGKEVLNAMSKLHAFAESDRETTGLSEGRVYDWMPLARDSLLPARTWRDALLAIRTRDADFVVLGRGISSDGTGAPRDMVEGVLVRLFHGLEMLYPQALRKEAALKFRVRPRGAAYYHLLACLEKLGRGQASIMPLTAPQTKVEKVEKVGSKRGKGRELEQLEQEPRKRPRRGAAIAASKKATTQLGNEQVPLSETKLDQISEAKVSIDSVNQDETVADEFLALPKIKTTLWAHQERSVASVVEGVRQGKRGHADASAVGAGKTLTALATIVRLAHWIEESEHTRHGVLVMLPTKSLIKEWLLEIAAHTEGFHVIEQREDGSLFSLTYGKNHPPIDGNSLIISTLDRVCNHPFVRQAAWDFVVIDECLSVQNAAAKRNPSAWRQIEVSLCGVLMLSATFFRSKFDQLFYMIRMLRSPLPRTMEWLPATIHEHIVCQIPETDRQWSMKSEMVPLPPQDLRKYRDRIEGFRRKQINEPSEVDGRKLWVDLESFLRTKYEGRESRSSYAKSSPMGGAFAKVSKSLLRKGRRPLIFADTSQESDFLLGTLRQHGLDAQTWANIASQRICATSKTKGNTNKTVIVAVKTVEGQGINMQGHADAIICRPTPGDHLEQMKGRVDRPGQARKDLLLVVMVCEHTIEEAKFANIRLAGNFFREYIAPVAQKYKERIDLEATLAAGGKQKLKSGTVSGVWRKSLEAAGQSGTFAKFDHVDSTCSNQVADDDDSEEEDSFKEKKPKAKAAKEKEEPKYKPLNKVLRNKGDPEAVRQAKSLAKSGQASLAVRRWLFPPKASHVTREKKGLGKNSLLRFSDAKPPIVLGPETVYKAVTQLSKNDPKLAALIARVGADALVADCGTPGPPTQARLFDRCVRAITFTMISVDAGNAFMRRLAMKIGTCLENRTKAVRDKLLKDFVKSIKEGGNQSHLRGPDHLLDLLLAGETGHLTFTCEMMRELVDDCEVIKGKQTGYPHLCGVTYPCGKNDNHSIFLEKSRAHAKGKGDPVSAGYSNAKAGFMISLVKDFESGKISGEKIAKASDREAVKMLMELEGIGDWCACGVLMHFLSRADVILYGDLTVRNYLNDLYDINHLDGSETLLESAADFADTGPNRDLIDKLATERGWAPYRSVVCYLMYHLQEENLVLI